MNLDDIKKEFIQFMESMHGKTLFPKKYFGCMMAVFIEQKPVTQERIKELTGYSLTTISQMLNLIQMTIHLKKIKKPKIRKKFYTIAIPPQKFMLIFLKVIMDSYKNKVDFFLPLIEEVKTYTQKHVRFLNFHDYLKKFYDTSILYLNLISDTSDDFDNLIETGQVSGSSLLDLNLVYSPENLKLLQDLIKPPPLPNSFSELPIMPDELSKIYSQLKNKFYQEFRENLTSGESQIDIAKTIIGTEILLENRPITQSEIENATSFARSIISDVLKLLLEMKMIRLIKKPNDRKKYYFMNLSWERWMLNKLRINMKNAVIMRQKISYLIIKVKQENQNEEILALITFLQHIYNSYTCFEQYFKLLEIKYLNNRLKEYLEKEDSKDINI